MLSTHFVRDIAKGNGPEILQVEWIVLFGHKIQEGGVEGRMDKSILVRFFYHMNEVRTYCVIGF